MVGLSTTVFIVSYVLNPIFVALHSVVTVTVDFVPVVPLCVKIIR